MYLKSIKQITVLQRVIKQLNKKMLLNITEINIPVLYIIYQLHLNSITITNTQINNKLRLLNRQTIPTTLNIYLNKFVECGFLTVTTTQIKNYFWTNTYYVQPALILYLNELEKRLRKVRWDY